MNRRSPTAQHILNNSLKVGNHPSIGKGVSIYEYENSYSPFLRVGQILKCYSFKSDFYFDVDVITDHVIELIYGGFMRENKSITNDLKGKIKKPKPIYGAKK